MYEFLLSVHLLAAVLWVGGGVSVFIFGRFARLGGPQRMVDFSREANLIGPRFYAPLSLILLIAGFLLIEETFYEFSELWISLGLAGWLVSFVVGVGFYGPQQKKLDAAVVSDGLDAPAVRQIYDRVMLVNGIELVILMLVVIDMAVKPGA